VDVDAMFQEAQARMLQMADLAERERRGWSSLDPLLAIVFTGLCALVADGDRAPGQVLLVDAKGVGEVGGVVLPAHAPTLVASLSSLANADTSNPTRVAAAWPGRGSTAAGAIPGREPGGPVDQIGLWDLTGTEVRIRVQGREKTGVELFRPPDGTSSWPQPPRNIKDPASWRDVRFVANMNRLAGDGRINLAFVGTGDAPGDGLPRAVASRIHLDGGVVEAGIPSLEVYRGDVFEFRGAAPEPRLRQALTDTIRWSLKSDAGAVVIEIVPVAGGSIRRLVLAPSATAHSLFVSNLPTGNAPGEAHHGLSDEQMAALHFGAYYKLLTNEPADKPLPRLRLAPARRGAGGVGPLFCPPARFSLN
jgi:hypothetical protein